MFKNLDLEKMGSQEQKVEEPERKTELFAEQLEVEAKKMNGKVYTFTLKNGVKVSVVANIEEILHDKYEDEFKFLPKSFAQKYTKFVLNHPKVTEDYLLGLLYNVDNILDHGQLMTNKHLSDNPEEDLQLQFDLAKQIKGQLMPADQVNAITEEVFNDFVNSNKRYTDIATQTLMELAYELSEPKKNKVLLDNLLKKLDNDEIIDLKVSDLVDGDLDDFLHQDVLKRSKLLSNHNIAFLNPLQISKMLTAIGFTKLNPAQVEFVDKTLKKYEQPLSTKEIRKITSNIIDSFINYDTKNSSALKEPYSFIYNAAQKNITKYPQIKTALLKILEKSYVLPQNTTLRYFIDDKADKRLLEAKTERLIIEIIEQDPQLLALMSSIDLENMERYIRPFDYTMYNKMLGYRLIAASYFDSILKNK